MTRSPENVAAIPELDGPATELHDELSWLNALLTAQIAAFRHVVDDPYRGLYISDPDVDATLAALPLAEPPPAYVELLDRSLARWQARCEQSPETPLDHLTRAANLAPVERATLLLCLAPEIDSRYGRVYAYLHDDVGRKAPTVELVSRTFSATGSEREALRGALATNGRLRAWGLIHVASASMPRLADELELEPRVAAYLLGLGDSGPPPWIRAHESAAIGRSDPAAGELVERIAADDRPAVVHLLAPTRRLRTSFAAQVASQLGCGLFVVDALDIASPDADLPKRLRRLRCEALLGGAVVCWENLDHGSLADAARVALHRELDSGLALHFVDAAAFTATGARARQLVTRVSEPTVREREALWRGALAGARHEGELDLATLAARYPLDPGQIADAARLAISAAAPEPVATGDLEEACRTTTAPQLEGLAQRVVTPFRRRDLVVPEATSRALDDICTHARYRALVAEDWGFPDVAGSRGLAVLFSGPPGTGKTMSAGIIARELGLELYRIDLSGVVSKYIGETEKNLARVFDACRNSAACLLFDEADALFAKRSEVTDSRDRFANLETSYLLQRVEQHEGLVFLCTNLRHNIDSAFLRRLQFVVPFEAPDHAHRALLWRRVWPKNAPLAGDLDLDFMARSFKLTGGHIKNIAVAAAVSAFAAGRPVEMQDIVEATTRELEKLGRTCSADDFGPHRLAASQRT